ncbi:MAG: hypothetical protein HRU20_05620 [Pseudomonadales bacterium]|nr:hypothetical protein [Pseudomonadales bacterium]
MRLQRQILIFILLTSVLSMGSTYAILGYYIQSEFSDFEKNQILKDTKRTKNLLNNAISELSLLTRDWSIWDDSYIFIDTQNQSFLDINVSREALNIIDVNYLVLSGSDGQIIYARSLKPDDSELQLLNKKEQEAFSALVAYQRLHQKKEVNAHQ